MDILKTLHSNSDKALNAFMALCAFTFTAAGDVISAPNWLIIVSATAMVACAGAFVYFQRQIKKISKHIRGYEMMYLAIFSAVLFIAVLGFAVYNTPRTI